MLLEIVAENYALRKLWSFTSRKDLKEITFFSLVDPESVHLCWAKRLGPKYRGLNIDSHNTRHEKESKVA